MKPHQVEVTYARSGEEALSKIKLDSFDLFLLDAWLPVVDGFELCRQIRESDPTTPVLFYSGAAYETDKQRAYAAGANAYVTKPDVDALIETMLDLIAKTKVYDADAGRALSHVPAAESRSASLFFNVRTASD